MIKIFIFIFLSTKLLFSELFWDGRFYHQSLFDFIQKDKKILTKYSGLNILDLKIDNQISEILRLRSEIEYFILNNSQNFGLYSQSEGINLNTLNVIVSPENFKFTFGRFLPDWGKGKFFKPLDIFKPQLYILNALSFKGVDAISLKYYFSSLSSFEFITLPSFDVRNILPYKNLILTNQINNTILAGNLELHIGSFDNNIIFLKDTSKDISLAGFAFKGDLILGIWGEFFYSFDTKNNKIFKTSSGIDYSVNRKYFFTAEFFYDESGTENKEEYNILRLNPLRMTVGKYYSMFDFNILTENDINYGITYLCNLIDKSFILFPYVKSEIFQNFLLGLSLYHFNGKSKTEFSPILFGNYLLNFYIVVLF